MNNFPYSVFYSIEEFRNEVEILGVIQLIGEQELIWVRRRLGIYDWPLGT